MKKNRLINKVARRSGVTPRLVELVIDGLRDVVALELAEGNDVNVYGFVNFELSQMKERFGYNPYTGEKETYPCIKKVKAKPSKIIKQAARGELLIWQLR